MIKIPAQLDNSVFFGTNIRKFASKLKSFYKFILAFEDTHGNAHINGILHWLKNKKNFPLAGFEPRI